VGLLELGKNQYWFIRLST